MLMEQPFGPALIALAGLAVLGNAAFQAYRAYTAKFQDDLQQADMSEQEQDFACVSGRLGHAARAITFAIVGMFLVIAALRHEPGQARGLGGALDTLLQQPYGPALLGVVAIGLIAYGLYMLVEARYRRMAV
jgi:hypothetical protein